MLLKSLLALAAAVSAEPTLENILKGYMNVEDGMITLRTGADTDRIGIVLHDEKPKEEQCIFIMKELDSAIAEKFKDVRGDNFKFAQFTKATYAEHRARCERIRTAIKRATYVFEDPNPNWDYDSKTNSFWASIGGSRYGHVFIADPCTMGSFLDRQRQHFNTRLSVAGYRNFKTKDAIGGHKSLEWPLQLSDDMASKFNDRRDQSLLRIIAKYKRTGAGPPSRVTPNNKCAFFQVEKIEVYLDGAAIYSGP